MPCVVLLCPYNQRRAHADDEVFDWVTGSTTPQARNALPKPDQHSLDSTLIDPLLGERVRRGG